MRRFSLIAGGLAAVTLALSPIAVAAVTTTKTGISGWELFPGIRSGGITYGATFAGWTDLINTDKPVSWAPPPGSRGNWILSINYTGTAGVAVTVTRGLWSLRMADGSRYSGYVASGNVVWKSWNSGACQGNANVDLVLVIASGGGGNVNGCLDDQHLTTVFPPHVWGTVTLNVASNPPPPPHDGGGDG
jgi:hypothetical protein